MKLKLMYIDRNGHLASVFNDSNNIVIELCNDNIRIPNLESTKSLIFYS